MTHRKTTPRILKTPFSCGRLVAIFDRTTTARDTSAAVPEFATSTEAQNWNKIPLGSGTSPLGANLPCLSKVRDIHRDGAPSLGVAAAISRTVLDASTAAAIHQHGASEAHRWTGESWKEMTGLSLDRDDGVSAGEITEQCNDIGAKIMSLAHGEQSGESCEYYYKK